MQRIQKMIPLSRRRYLKGQRRSVTLSSKKKVSSDNNATNEPLLLECDPFFFSKDGVSRTLYRIESTTTNSFCNNEVSFPYTIEEIFDTKKSTKTYIIREQPLDHQAADIVNLLSSNKHNTDTTIENRFVTTVMIQELDDIEHIGTGATTWEASIAASLYFTGNPNQLRGDLVELGSGVGTSGIFNAILSSQQQHSSSSLRSMTFTDYCDDVLQLCKQNLHNAQSVLPPDLQSAIKVTKLDWNKFSNLNKKFNTYDTVVACDIAYHYEDVESISKAIKTLLRPDSLAKAHLFGPYNRAVLLEVVRYLRDELNMTVRTEMINLNRVILKPKHSRNKSSWKFAGMKECTPATTACPKFLHVSVSKPSSREKDEGHLSDID